MLDINSFDEKAIAWRELPDNKHVWLSILDIDETAKIVDVLFRFAASKKIVLHRHVATFAKETAGMRVNVNTTQLQSLKAYPRH